MNFEGGVNMASSQVIITRTWDLGRLMNEGMRKEEKERDGVPYTLPSSADVSVSTAGYCNGAINSDGSLGGVRWSAAGLQLRETRNEEEKLEGLERWWWFEEEMLRHGVQSMWPHTCRAPIG
jgi:hypothetical protein